MDRVHFGQLKTVLILAMPQVVSWGTLGLLSIVGRDIAVDLHIDIAFAFAGSSVLYVTMGLCGPVLASRFTRFGARRVMMAGSIVSALGFCALATARNEIAYVMAWLLLGVAGSGSLTTAAHIFLNETAGRQAKGSIAALVTITGLSSSLFWPLTSYLNAIAAWRGVSLIFALLMVSVSLLYWLCLPKTFAPEVDQPDIATEMAALSLARDDTFLLVSAAIALNAFVTFGFSAVMIELLRSEGVSTQAALAFGSALGFVQVVARGADLLGGGKWDGLTTAIVAGLALPFSMSVLALGHGNYWAIGCFILFYGLGSGALAVSRATIPLVFYDRAEFAKATSRIALPLNMVSAASPPLLVGLLTRYGSGALLGLATLCSCGAWALLLVLRTRRPRAQAVPA